MAKNTRSASKGAASKSARSGASKGVSKAASKGTGSKAAPKKSAPAKSAPPADKKEAKAAKFKNGEMVEFQDSRTLRGIYQDGKVFIGGVEHTPDTKSLKKVDEKKLSDGEKQQVDNATKKAQGFEEIGVPRERIGENLHEDNVDLQMSIKQRDIKNTVRKINNAEESTLYGEAAADRERAEK